MAMRHNCILGSYTKPLNSQINTTELVINQTDGTLWTKRLNGEVIQINPDLETLDKKWKFIGESGQPIYKNGFISVDNNDNSKSGLGYRLFDKKTLQITGRVKTTKNLSRGSYTLFTFNADIVNRLVGLNHQFSIATISPTLNAGQNLILNVKGHLDLNIISTIYNNDEISLDCYFQLN